MRRLLQLPLQLQLLGRQSLRQGLLLQAPGELQALVAVPVGSQLRCAAAVCLPLASPRPLPLAAAAEESHAVLGLGSRLQDAAGHLHGFSLLAAGEAWQVPASAAAAAALMVLQGCLAAEQPLLLLPLLQLAAAEFGWWVDAESHYLAAAVLVLQVSVEGRRQ